MSSSDIDGDNKDVPGTDADAPSPPTWATSPQKMWKLVRNFLAVMLVCTVVIVACLLVHWVKIAEAKRTAKADALASEIKLIELKNHLKDLKFRRDKLKIYVQKAFLPLNITLTSNEADDKFTLDDKNIKLTCTSENGNDHKYTFVESEDKYLNSTDIQVQVNSTDDTYTISQVTEQAAKTYFCWACNDEGVSDPSDPLTLVLIPTVPRLTSSGPTTDYKQNTTVKLTCQARRASRYTFYQDSNVVTGSTEKQSANTVDIPSFQQTDEGNYTCRAFHDGEEARDQSEVLTLSCSDCDDATTVTAEITTAEITTAETTTSNTTTPYNTTV